MSQTVNNPYFILKDVSVYSEIPLKTRIQVLLQRIGRSQNWLADEVGVSRGTMSKIVNGGWIPSSQIKLRMSQLLEVDSLVLFGNQKYWSEWREKIGYEI